MITRTLRKTAAWTMAGLLVAGGALALTDIHHPSPAHAETKGPERSSAASPMFVYLEAGEYLYARATLEKTGGPGIFGITDPSGNVIPGSGDLDAGVGSPGTGNDGAPGAGTDGRWYGPASESGVWQVQIGDSSKPQDERMSADWEVSATAGPDEPAIPGRVWAETFYVIQEDTPAGHADFTYYAANDSGYQYTVNLGGFNGIYSTILVNDVGIIDASGDPYGRSIESQGEPRGRGDVASLTNMYRLFLEPPAADLPAEAKLSGQMVPVLPAPLQEPDLEPSEFTFTQDLDSDTKSGEFSWSLTPRFQGTYWLEIDADGDGGFDGEADHRIQMVADGTGQYTAEFNGQDGLGVDINRCEPMNARLYFDRVGEMHVVQSDVEGRSGGIEITRTNGPGSPDSTIYWDDTALSTVVTGTNKPVETQTPVRDGTGGVDSTGGVHGWDYHVQGWGNDRLIDDWTYVPIEQALAETNIPGEACLTLEKDSTHDGNDAEVGEVVDFTVTVTNDGSEEIEIPLVDDLSDVLDDAEFDEDSLQITYSGVDPASQSPADPLFDASDEQITWTGPLKAGETVTMTYSVTVTEGGNRLMTNTVVATDLTDNDGNPLTDTTSSPIPAYDFGDAPDIYGTTLAEDGARHRLVEWDSETQVAPLMLGSEVTAELDGAPAPEADSDEDDGISDLVTFVPGEVFSTTVTATNNTDRDATLVAWVDSNGDGSFDQEVSVMVPAHSGTNDYPVTFPAELTTTDDTYLRLRLFDGDTSTEDHAPTGLVTGGEVEDYLVQMEAVSFVIEKVGQGPTGAIPLDGSSFEIRDDDGGQPGDIANVQPDAVAHGLFLVDLIAPGEYWLTETKAPTGYNLLAESVKFTVESDGAITLDDGAPEELVSTRVDSEGQTVIRVMDIEQYALPLTGGAGNAPYLTGAAVLMVMAAAGGTVRVRSALSHR